MSWAVYMDVGTSFVVLVCKASHGRRWQRLRRFCVHAIVPLHLFYAQPPAASLSLAGNLSISVASASLDPFDGSSFEAFVSLSETDSIKSFRECIFDLQSPALSLIVADTYDGYAWISSGVHPKRSQRLGATLISWGCHWHRRGSSTCKCGRLGGRGVTCTNGDAPACDWTFRARLGPL